MCPGPCVTCKCSSGQGATSPCLSCSDECPAPAAPQPSPGAAEPPPSTAGPAQRAYHAAAAAAAEAEAPENPDGEGANSDASGGVTATGNIKDTVTFFKSF